MIMKFDPKKIIFKPRIIGASGLNLAEYKRVIREIYISGIEMDEKYNTKITKPIEEPKSRFMVHVKYIWRKDPDGDVFLNIRYVKKMRSRKKINKWGKVV